MFKPMTLAMAGLMMLALAGCGDGGSAVETRDRKAEGEAAPSTGAGFSAGGSDARAEGQVAPDLTANRRESVDEKVVRLFERNGADFGARTPQDYLQKVRAFTGSPPSGTERIERANGDVLLYQASTNTFAVVSREGVPKTMFKSESGPAYWAEQKERAPTFGRRQGSERSGE